MQAHMRMKLDTAFGNTCEVELIAELDNPHDLANKTIFTDMARMIRGMVEEVRAENERELLAREPGGKGDNASLKSVDL